MVSAFLGQATAAQTQSSCSRTAQTILLMPGLQQQQENFPAVGIGAGSAGFVTVTNLSTLFMTGARMVSFFESVQTVGASFGHMTAAQTHWSLLRLREQLMTFLLISQQQHAFAVLAASFFSRTAAGVCSTGGAGLGIVAVEVGGGMPSS